MNNTYFLANICENSNDPTSRPVWKLLGYFSPSDPSCISLSDSQYESTFCDQSEISEVPSEMPTISTLVPYIFRSIIPYVLYQMYQAHFLQISQATFLRSNRQFHLL